MNCFDDFLKLFRKDASQTSVDAAASIHKDLRKFQSLVLEYAKTKPEGFTDEEMNAFFDTHRSTFRARRAELVRIGLIVNSGQKRKMVNGRNATVWLLKSYEEKNG